MTGRAGTALIAIVLSIGVGGVGVLLGLSGITSACTGTAAPDLTVSVSDSPAPDLAGYDRDQLTHAATIVTVGAGRGIPTRGLVIAVATALQESTLRNLGDLGERNDHDSLGLFQQRPSQGWGAPHQILNPTYAAGRFYDALLTVPEWELMSLTEAAQAVQRSAHPGAYAKWEADATALVRASIGAYGGCVGGDGMSGAGEQLPADFAFPPDTPPAVVTAIAWAFGQLGTPYSFGGSCTDPHSGDPATQCDCSSLVQRAYHHAGVALPRVTDDQQHVGTPVAAVADLRPGDLIFIAGSTGTLEDPGHVGLYVGAGLLIQAPHTGDAVKLSTVASWGQIAAIRRVVAWPQPTGP